MTSTNTRRYELSELQRAAVFDALQIAFEDGGQGLHDNNLILDLQEQFRTAVPVIPLWRTLPEDIMDAIIGGYMEVENVDKHRAGDDLDQDEEVNSLYLYFADVELLAAVYNEDCCVVDFKGEVHDPKDPFEQPEARHWKLWQLMMRVGLCTDNLVTEAGLALIRYDNPSLIGE